jgi:hypothetical protein
MFACVRRRPGLYVLRDHNQVPWPNWDRPTAAFIANVGANSADAARSPLFEDGAFQVWSLLTMFSIHRAAKRVANARRPWLGAGCTTPSRGKDRERDSCSTHTDSTPYHRGESCQRGKERSSPRIHPVERFRFVVKCFSSLGGE